MWGFLCNTKARGVSFEGRQQLVKALAIGDVLQVVAEPTNEHHTGAHALYYRNAKIGYLRRDLADTLVSTTYDYRAIVTQLTGKDFPLQGVNLRLEVNERL